VPLSFLGLKVRTLASVKSRFLTASALCLCAACAPVQAAPEPPTVAPTIAAPLSPASPLPNPSVVPSATLAPAPTATASPTATPVPDITLIFTGDINPARCVYTIAKSAGDMAAPYRAVGELLQTADLAIGSLDASISDFNPPSPCAEFHRNLLAPSEVVQGMQWAGFDLMAAATNHIKDCGLTRGCVHDSLLDTITHLRAAGVEPVGIGRNLAEATAPVIVTVRGVRFAFLAFTAINGEVWATETAPGAAPFLPEVYVEAVRRAQAQADVVIVLPHWGREFTGQISWEQALGAQRLVEAGATLVVGNNPHHVQGVETFPNGAVAAYALGNFVFDQEWSDGTLYTIQGLLLKATFRGAELQSVELLPIRIHDNFQPRLAAPEEAAQILRDVEESLRTKPGEGD
jgi:poly-gamma-glutamate synthesis protein (capsule biosynthesis protein)